MVVVGVSHLDHMETSEYFLYKASRKEVELGKRDEDLVHVLSISRENDIQQRHMDYELEGVKEAPEAGLGARPRL